MRLRCVWLLAVSLVMAIGSAGWARPAEQTPPCHTLPRCTGCGCRGGPGYRGPNGQCVGYHDLDRVCGSNPTQHCTFENLPNTGLNRDCVLQRGHRRPEAPTG